jgi:hypothetical protein
MGERMSEPSLRKRQEIANKVRERMLFALLDYSPCSTLTVSDVQFISEWARTIAFDAMTELEEAAE